MGLTLFKSARRSPEEELSRFSDAAQSALGARLNSIVVFGSSASGEYRRERSDVNLLILVDTLSFATLKDLSPALESWKRRQRTDPVLLSEGGLSIYARALPIEFLDVKEHHRVLFGQDPFKELQISTENLRAQCQQELSIKLLKLRQALALHARNKKVLRELIVKSSSSILSLFRAILRLDGETPPPTKLKAGQRLAEKLGVDPSDLEKIYELRVRRENDSVEELAGRYLGLIEKALGHVAGRPHGT
jgi:predicted nucleotidyltransferase